MKKPSSTGPFPAIVWLTFSGLWWRRPAAARRLRPARSRLPKPTAARGSPPSRGIYRPVDAASGGPFTIGRVIHSSRRVGFTGWIGGVAVFDRALSARELAGLAAIGRLPPLAGGAFSDSGGR
jgi:hypothetical protein